MKGKKNGFINFCLAFVPGCAEMYMGFMKMGVSLMTLFFGVLFLCSMFGWEEAIYFEFIVWFYSFFHARNMAHASEIELQQMQDCYLFSSPDTMKSGMSLAKKYRNIVGGLLIYVGVSLICKAVLEALDVPEIIWSIYDMIVGHSLQIMVGVGIIVVGYRLICSKKQELWSQEEEGEMSDGEQKEYIAIGNDDINGSENM